MKIKVVPAVIATVFGVCFLAAEIRYNYYPPIPVVSLSSFNAPEERKARAAVTALLLDPESAAIGELRTVKPHGVLYVCGRVNGKDRSKKYAGFRDFVYEVAGDFAIIDRDEEISRSHRSFRPCPVEEKPKPLVVDLDKLNKIAKVLPKPDVQFSTVPSSGGGASANGRGGSQDLRQAKGCGRTSTKTRPGHRRPRVRQRKLRAPAVHHRRTKTNGVATNRRKAGRNSLRTIRYRSPKLPLPMRKPWSLRPTPNVGGNAMRMVNRRSGPPSRRSRRPCERS